MQGFLRNRFIPLFVEIIVTLLILRLIGFRRRPVERFSAESFARAVLAQNPKVFKRLAEM
jgi:hypothetical protein